MDTLKNLTVAHVGSTVDEGDLQRIKVAVGVVMERGFSEPDALSLVWNRGDFETALRYMEHMGQVSLDNGGTYKLPEELTDEEAAQVAEQICANHDEIWAIWDHCTPADSNRDAVMSFMAVYPFGYVIG